MRLLPHKHVVIKRLSLAWVSQRLLQHMILLGCLLLSFNSAFAHQSSTAYLSIQQNSQGQTQAEYRLAIRDLALITPLDSNQDLQISWGEVKGQQYTLYQQLAQQLQWSAAKQGCAAQQQQPLALDKIAGMTYVLAAFRVDCGQYPPDQLHYSMLAQIDSGHRLIISMQQADAASRSWMLGAGTSSLQHNTLRQTFSTYVQEGIHHLISGYDHLLFLLCLLLPAVYRRDKGQWLPVSHAGTAIKQTFYIATAFTLAHSITLSLAALHIVAIPARIIESIIAFSIALAALNNLIPLFGKRQVLIAFVFGLVHGFGFANVLSSLPLEASARVMALFSFNVGIELGQLACIMLFMPLALLLRRQAFYRVWMLQGGSTIAGILALLWMIQRIFDLNLIPG